MLKFIASNSGPEFGTIRYEYGGRSYSWPAYMPIPGPIKHDKFINSVLPHLSGEDVVFVDASLVVAGKFEGPDSSHPIAKAVYKYNAEMYKHAFLKKMEKNAHPPRPRGFNKSEIHALAELLLESGKISENRARELKGEQRTVYKDDE